MPADAHDSCSKGRIRQLDVVVSRLFVLIFICKIITNELVYVYVLFRNNSKKFDRVFLVFNRVHRPRARLLEFLKTFELKLAKWAREQVWKNPNSRLIVLEASSMRTGLRPTFSPPMAAAMPQTGHVQGR